MSDIKLNPTYVDEVLNGTIDHKVDEGNLSYTYHRRIWNWGKRVEKHDKDLDSRTLPKARFFIKNELKEDLGINQMEYLIDKIVDETISRKLQVTTWIPWKDLKMSGAPCLQRLWFRIIEDPQINKERYLIMESHWRSRDLFKAWGSNVYAMVEIGKWIASELTEKLKTKIDLIQYVDISNSLHIYGSDFQDVEKVFTVLKKRGELV
ncbi:MAG: thymidylate synthase [Promethearchaeota archaeon]